MEFCYRKLILALFLILPFISSSQEREILDWNFFKNDRPLNAEHQAYTWYNLSYRYKFLKFDGDKANLNFTVVSKMDTTKSYFETARRLRNDTLLLKHEQGHADIAYIYAIKLRDTFAQASFSRNNFKNEIQDIFNRIFSEMREEQSKYDNESNHSRNFKEQKRWNLYFEKAVAVN